MYHFVDCLLTTLSSSFSVCLSCYLSLCVEIFCSKDFAHLLVFFFTFLTNFECIKKSPLFHKSHEFLVQHHLDSSFTYLVIDFCLLFPRLTCWGMFQWTVLSRFLINHQVCVLLIISQALPDGASDWEIYNFIWKA